MSFEPTYLDIPPSDPASFSHPFVKMPRTAGQEAQDVADLQANGVKIEKFAADVQAKKVADMPQAVEFDRTAGNYLRKDGTPMKPGDYPATVPIKFHDGSITSPEAVAGTTQNLMALGISPEAIDQASNGTPVTALERFYTQSWKDGVMKDKDFVSKYLAGEPDAMKRMTLADIVLSCPVKDEA